MLIKPLRFVQGAISVSRAGIPDMEHYRIRDGRIKAFNGRLALCAPFGMDIVAYPKAADFYKAVRACGDADEVRVKMTDGGKLGLTTGSFRAYIASLPDVDYDPEPEGELSHCPETLLEDMEIVAPFVSEDASRPWAMGVLCEAGCLTATNNIAIVRLHNGHKMPPINLPGFAVKELLRIGEVPTMLQATDRSVSFHYLDGSWMKTQLFNMEWPRQMIDRILGTPGPREPILPDLAEAVEVIAGFAENAAAPIYFEDGYVATSPHAQDGAMAGVPGLKGGPCFGMRPLRLVLGVAETFDPQGDPAPFTGAHGRLRGALLPRNR